MRLRSLTGVVVAAACLAGASCGGDASHADGTTTTASTTTAPTTTADPTADCPDAPPERLVPQVDGEIPHDPTAFTQGLVVHRGELFESTGLENRSTIRAMDPATGQIRSDVALGPGTFAEGLAVGADGDLVQLTWKEGRAYVWDPTTLEQVGGFEYQGEGWGLTTLDDGTLVQSDGSTRLTERDPVDFSVTDTWTVARSDGAVDQLNELEWDGTHLWANRWRTDEIVRIDPTCRRVDGVVDASSLESLARADAAASGGPGIDVLNGIAKVPDTDQFLVTGKLWPSIYRVRFVPA